MFTNQTLGHLGWSFVEGTVLSRGRGEDGGKDGGGTGWLHPGLSPADACSLLSGQRTGLQWTLAVQVDAVREEWFSGEPVSASRAPRKAQGDLP